MSKGNRVTKIEKDVICALCNDAYSVIIPVKGVTIKDLKCRTCREKGLKLAQKKTKKVR